MSESDRRILYTVVALFSLTVIYGLGFVVGNMAWMRRITSAMTGWIGG